jgi:thymidylate synthase (FAD)
MASTEGVIQPGDKPDELTMFGHGFVRLDASMADDLSVVNSARVSFAVRKEEMDDRDAGLIKFLMRDRHGCYDDNTEVLTDQGWKAWPDVTGEEYFATLSRAQDIEFQPAVRLVRKEHRGHMIGFKGTSVDLLVTPDHRVLSAVTTTRPRRQSPTFGLRPAHSVLWRAHRHTSVGRWTGLRLHAIAGVPTEPLMRMVGFFIGDGHFRRGGTPSFHLRKEREIAFLRKTAAECGFGLTEKRGEHYWLLTPPEIRDLFAQCYDSEREKVIPRYLLDGDQVSLAALFEGLMSSDGSRQPRKYSDRLSYATTSKVLADQVQELALRLGTMASVRPHKFVPGDGHFGTKPRWRVTIYAARNSHPALCRTRADADNQMGVEEYNGNIHCVEVPNGTLYVRRNGYPVFCGNTPFEHNSFRFHVRAPIFVAREWFRHRVSSFNEESGRYHKLQGDFYVPDRAAVRSQVGKPGAYTFDPVEEDLAGETIDRLQRIYKELYEEYLTMVEKGVAKELARSILPFGIFTQFYWTLNARSLMNFLSLRNAEAAQYEIRVYAEAVERLFAEKMPITHQSFVEFGRRAP